MRDGRGADACVEVDARAEAAFVQEMDMLRARSGRRAARLNNEAGGNFSICRTTLAYLVVARRPELPAPAGRE